MPVPFCPGLFTVNTAGTPPFQGSVQGVPAAMASLILISINQQPPFDIKIGILDTELWSKNMVEVFYLIVRDRMGLEGSITIKIAKSECSKAQETDKSTELRAKLKVVQARVSNLRFAIVIVS